MSLAVGTRLGSYEITGAVGSGGMGEVYRAHDARLGRDVAVNVLPASVSADPAALARLEREARASRALNHPNVVDVYDTGRENDVSFVVMEPLEGETLRSRLEGTASHTTPAHTVTRDGQRFVFILAGSPDTTPMTVRMRMLRAVRP